MGADESDPEDSEAGNGDEEAAFEMRHVFSDSYEVLAASGVEGGYQPGGDFKIDFLYDHDYRTTAEEYDENGVMTQIRMNDFMEREHLVGVSMSPEDAQEAAIYILNRVLGDQVSRDDLVTAIQDAVDQTDDTS